MLLKDGAAAKTLFEEAPLPLHDCLNAVRVPCSADSALRRSIPAFNKDVREVQTRLEDVAFKLRIPQRKPWAPMADDIKSASSIVAQPERVSPAGRVSISQYAPFSRLTIPIRTCLHGREVSENAGRPWRTTSSRPPALWLSRSG